MTRVPERLEWAVSRLALQRDHHVLELGCGHGVAAGLVCDRLRGGHLTAVDRSAAMIDRARRRNAHHVEAGTLDFAVAAIAKMCLPSTYDIVFAVDVNVFGQTCANELRRIRAHMSDDSVLHIVHRPPVDAKLQRFADNLAVELPANGFVIDDITVASLSDIRILGVRARPNQ